MDFYEVLDEVLELLRRRGRVTYRALKVQFQLDDEQLEALKEEIIYAQQVARDEENRVLVWTGETEESPVTTAQSDQPEPQPVIEQTQPPSVASPPTNAPEAERRQLTVMFVDLVGSTSLSGELDPEDLREVVRAYQSACTDVIQRYDGHVAQLLGDGLLVYFGYPVAHEDDAQRAVHTGLGILNVIETLNTRLEQDKQDKGINLAVRLGVHTGLVVVGEMGGGKRQEQLALGETPNLAARIQGIAEPDSVVISDATHRLIQGFFDCESLGEHDLRGVSQPIPVYRVLGDSGIQSRLDVAGTRGLTPLVGRESESTLLFERWEQAKDGNGQVILLSGEAGIGKSRLAQALKDHVAYEPHIRWECRSSPYFTNSALYPVIDLIQRTLRWQPDDTPELRLEKLEENLSQYRLPLDESVPLFGVLLSLPVPEDRYPPLNLSPQRQRQKTLESIVAILLELAERQPVLFILEDGHWLDASTQELLGFLIDQVPMSPILVLITYRPEFQPTWGNRSYLTQVTLNRLSPNQIESIATQVAGGKTLPGEVLQQLVERTDGVPLYVEEMTKAVLESGVLKDVDGQYELTGSLSSLAIPATLQDSLMARLDRLMTSKVVAQLGATIGRQFEYDLLHAVAQIDEPTLQRELGRLVEAELIYQRGLPPNATYTFKHALIQDTAYESLLRRTRQQYHQRIAQTLEERFSEMAETQPELLAHHHTEAGLNEQAVDFWKQAGERASTRSALAETISHLDKGLELLKTLPETKQNIQREIAFQVALGPALMAVKGYGASEVEQVYMRAQQLCQQFGETFQLFRVLVGLGRIYIIRGDLHRSRELGERTLTLAQTLHDDGALVFAHQTLGNNLCFLGMFAEALEHLEQALTLYDTQRHATLAYLYGDDPGGAALTYIGLALWYRGYPDQALTRMYEALTLTEQLIHPFSYVYALMAEAWLHQWRREGQETQTCSEAVIALSTEQGFPLRKAQGTIYHGWSLFVQGRRAEGMTQIRQGLTALLETETKLNQTMYLALLTWAYGEEGQLVEGLHLLTEAFTIIENGGERWYEAEIHRLKGELLLQQSSDNAIEAESCFHQSITIAQNQSAKSWELRAATSLARLWKLQGKQTEVRELLEPVYSWFTEGFDTADLIEAKDLLDELEASQ